MNTRFLLILCCLTLEAFSSDPIPNIVDDHISVDCGSDLTASHSSNFRLKGSSSSVSTPSLQPPPPPYNTARISRSQFSYSFQLNPGQKFIRLLFNPTSYSQFKSFHDFFTVEAGPFTLLSNFSASVTADATFAKEFCLSVHDNRPFSIVFSPATQHTYAFINGIEIISVPSSLDYCHGGDTGVQVVGDKSVIYIHNTTALELVTRKDTKRDSVPLGDDIGAMLMFRMWAGLHKHKSINRGSNITWKVSVDVGFRYLIRFHFCEIGLKMAETARKDFTILINHTVATTSAEILQKRENNGTLWYKNYMVMVNGNKREGKSDIFISLHSKDDILDRYGPLEGFEIFKLSNHDNSLASPTTLPTTRDSPTHAVQIILSVLGLRNAIATAIIAIFSLVNIILHLLLKLLGDDFHGEENKPSTRAQRLCRHFSLAEMQSATDNFNDAFVIGRGGFGKVYKGRIDKGKETVAIKRLKPNSQQGTREFWTEIETLSNLQHVNVVSLIGYCNEEPEMILVYEYMPCGSLADYLYKFATKYDDRSSLSWKERLEICIGAGRGIDYLHMGHQHPFIHLDIKASNILLDENFVAKVSDFGLAKLECETELQSQGSTNLRGTFGYIDPNYFKTRRITTKSDTYSFGVVLLEVLCGRPAVEPWIDEDKRSLSMWALDNISKGEADQIVAPSLRGEILPDSLMTFVRITKRCLHDEPKKRPAMAHIVINLEVALEQQANAKPLVPNEITSLADFFPFSSRVLHENANHLVPNEMMDSADNLPQQVNVNPMAPNDRKEFGDAVTERTNKKMNNAGTREGTKNIVKKLSRRIWPWDPLWKTAKSSKKKESGDILMSVPLLRGTRNMTPRESTFPEKRLAGSNDVKFTPNLTQKEITDVADVPFFDKAQQENVNSLVPNEIKDVDEVFPCTDRTFVSMRTRQKTLASSITRNGTSPLTEQIDSKTVNPGAKDLIKTKMHKLWQPLWPWDTSQKTTKLSKKKDAGNIFIPAPMSHKTKNTMSRPSTSSEKKVAGGNEMIPTPNLKSFSFSELKEATRNFRPDTILGEGGFGSVFKGWLKENSKLGSETIVAIKMLNPENCQGLPEWLTEVKFLGRLSHPNLVKLLGYCNCGHEKLLLVYEFMQKGSLENHLFRRGSSIEPLTWDIRLKILIGAARGLSFLHTLETAVIHRDFKASNILLDGSYNAKLSDFGLAKSGRMGCCTHVSTSVMGTYGYAAPEYIATGHLYVKSDVYSFGVVLVEMLTGLQVLDQNRPSGQQNLVDWVKPHLSERRKLKKIMDVRLKGRYPAPSALQMSRLALNCLIPDPRKRPSMAQVLDTLEKVYAAVDKPGVQFRDQP